MGILNVTPDSFSDGGLFSNPKTAIDHALRMEGSGADIIDIGGESTRPGADPVSIEEEGRRVLPIIQKLARRLSIPISIDTTRSEIARKALEYGASIVNDVSGFTRDRQTLAVAAEFQAGIVIMHAKGTPETMQRHPAYHDVVEEVYLFFERKIQNVMTEGIHRNQITIDPGIGFGKTVRHNLKLINQLHRFLDFGLPVMIGPSRKSFIGKILGLPPLDRLDGTSAAAAISVFNGGTILRVHDVGPLSRVVQVAAAIRREDLVKK